MIDAVLALLDRAVSLLKIRSENRRKVFDDHVEPLFSDILAVHGDYQKVFAESEALVRSPEFDLERARAWFAERRSELLPIRQKVTVLALALSKTSGLPSEAKNFFDSVCSYFSVAAGNDYMTVVSSATSVLLQAFKAADPTDHKHRRDLRWRMFEATSILNGRVY